jgi:putative flippase GtrA
MTVAPADRLRWQRHTFLRFATVGVANTLLTLAVIFALKGLAGTDDLRANALGYAVGLACSFLLNRRWTFGHTGRWLSALVRFTAVFLTAYATNLAVVLMLISVGLNDYVAHTAGMPLYTFILFFGCRFLVFREPADQARA